MREIIETIFYFVASMGAIVTIVAIAGMLFGLFLRSVRFMLGD